MTSICSIDDSIDDSIEAFHKENTCPMLLQLIAELTEAFQMADFQILGAVDPRYMMSMDESSCIDAINDIYDVFEGH